MRMSVAFAALTLLAAPALAQGQPTASTFDTMKPADAARLNQAVANDPQARQALDQVQNELNRSGHKAGKMLETTR